MSWGKAHFMIMIVAIICIFLILCDLIDSWKLFSENLQVPPKKIPPFYLLPPPKNSKCGSPPPLFVNIENSSPFPAERGGGHYDSLIRTTLNRFLTLLWNVDLDQVNFDRMYCLRISKYLYWVNSNYINVLFNTSPYVILLSLNRHTLTEFIWKYV